MYWDCQYNSLEECVPNVLSGNRGFCNVNPAFGLYAAKPTEHQKHRKRHQAESENRATCSGSFLSLGGQIGGNHENSERSGVGGCHWIWELGAVAIRGLHAQTKPPVYVVMEINEITDADGFKALLKTDPSSVVEAETQTVATSRAQKT